MIRKYLMILMLAVSGLTATGLAMGGYNECMDAGGYQGDCEHHLRK